MPIKLTQIHFGKESTKLIIKSMYYNALQSRSSYRITDKLITFFKTFYNKRLIITIQSLTVKSFEIKLNSKNKILVFLSYVTKATIEVIP